MVWWSTAGGVWQGLAGGVQVAPSSSLTALRLHSAVSWLTTVRPVVRSTARMASSLAVSVNGVALTSAYVALAGRALSSNVVRTV
jgi:hypothetical protein